MLFSGFSCRISRHEARSLLNIANLNKCSKRHNIYREIRHANIVPIKMTASLFKIISNMEVGVITQQKTEIEDWQVISLNGSLLLSQLTAKHRRKSSC